MSRFLEDFAFDPPELRAIFDDEAVLQHARAFEIALAQARYAEKQISADEAEAVKAACDTIEVAHDQLAAEAAHAGAFAIAFVRRLRGAPGAARAHDGATSQDLADTIVALQLKQAVALLVVQSRRITHACAALAGAHARTPMLARTLMQPALPISFGLRCAQWLTAVSDAAHDLNAAAQTSLTLQLGGGAGARHGLAGQGAFIAAHMGQALGLPVSALPDHARRGARARLGCAIAIFCGALGKIARDLSIMSQFEVGEAFEPSLPGRGGSSSMPHKHNPTACQIALTASARAPGLAASLIAGLPQEGERGLSGWQAEAPVLASLCRLAFASSSALATALERLDVHTDVMARNLARFGASPDLGESEALVRAALDHYSERP